MTRLFQAPSWAWPQTSMRLMRALAVVLAALFGTPALAADNIEIARAQLEASDDGYRLSASFLFDLTHELEDAIRAGVPLYFTTHVEMTRSRWYWLPEKAVDVSQTTRISFNPLTGKYSVAILDPALGGGSGVKPGFSTLEEAMFSIRRPNRWVVAPKGALKSGDTYNVTVQMGLNLDFLPTPIQVNSLNNSGWRLSSRKKTFAYRVE